MKRTNYSEILRYYLSGDYSQREIAQHLKISRNTISDFLKRLDESGITIKEASRMADDELRDKLYPQKQKTSDSYFIPDFEALAEEYKKPNMTKKLLWKRYVASCSGSGMKAYSVSQFNSLLDEYIASNNISMRRDRKPGEILELDWTGSYLLLHSRTSPATVKCNLFVATLPFSGYFYAEAFADQKLHSWITAVNNSLYYFEGVPVILRPDNLKTAVIKPDKYEPDLNEAMKELSDYYNTITLPARVRKPRDKNSVEATVGFITRQIIAALKEQIFYSIDDMNEMIWQMADELNKEGFSKKPGNRLELFLSQEKETLMPLPSKPFELFERAKAKVAPDYHVYFAHCYYSVHHTNAGKTVSIKASSNEVIIFDFDGKEIARHKRCLFDGNKSTLREHLPKEHEAVLGWSGESFRKQASKIGINTYHLIDMILLSREFEVQTYKTCIGILGLKKKFPYPVFEMAAEHAVNAHIKSYKSFRNLIESLAEAGIPDGGYSSADNLFLTHENYGDDEGDER